MGSFQQPGFTAQSDWEYDAQNYAAGYSGNSIPQQSAFGFGNDMSASSPMVYIPHGYGPQSIPATFHLPSAQAGMRRHVSSQRSPTSVEAEDEKQSRRIKRTRTACEECRKRKQKCDGGEPCQSCEEQSTECKYRDVPPTKKDDTMEKMVKLAETYNKTLANLNSDIDVMNATLRSIEARLNHGWQTGAGMGTTNMFQQQQHEPTGRWQSRHHVEHSPASSGSSSFGGRRSSD
ncbi:Putative zn(2)-C6 fungal-type DNA-binding domain-containing protein [Septoria linicola]|uniref:Zn(2)-C6 fungal-type DNA-binding domain-containing protein n=1 Tax=Septoria linicola TaxID=215465 RepID=A0A9Q9AMB3_9PEZI|nr:putative zn(2)-C6 fungal-type DNA-binding domain-containing protein [Septoria linicola]USW48733.1 Putative zn(2)-C6 fungal-type DNA-binding domain-containing protein [Septoria linicola]